MSLPTITLDYSADGSTFTGAPVAFTFLRTRVYKYTTFEEMGTSPTGRKLYRNFSYLRAELETTWAELDPNEDGSANTNWLFLQNWIAAPIRRMTWSTTDFASAGGYTQWNSSSNTNYVNIIEYEPSFIPSDWDDSLAQPSKRRFNIIVETRDVI